jgi:hypothetical protein
VACRQVTTTSYPSSFGGGESTSDEGRRDLMAWLGFSALWLLFCRRIRFTFLVNLRARSIFRLAGWRRGRGLRVCLPLLYIRGPALGFFKIAVRRRGRRPGRIGGTRVRSSWA